MSNTTEDIESVDFSTLDPTKKADLAVIVDAVAAHLPGEWARREGNLRGPALFAPDHQRLMFEPTYFPEGRIKVSWALDDPELRAQKVYQPGSQKPITVGAATGPEKIAAQIVRRLLAGTAERMAEARTRFEESVAWAHHCAEVVNSLAAEVPVDRLRSVTGQFTNYIGHPDNAAPTTTPALEVHHRILAVDYGDGILREQDATAEFTVQDHSAGADTHLVVVNVKAEGVTPEQARRILAILLED